MARHVLIVDSDAARRQALCGILCEDYSLLEAASGTEALALLRRSHESISAVLIELMQSESDGFDVLQRMRSDPRLARIPVIISTDGTDAEAEARALSLGANDFIVLPANPAVVRQRLRNNIHLIEHAIRIMAEQVAQEKQRDTFRQLQDILDNINSGISAVTIDEDNVVHFVFANEGYYAVLGYTKEQFEAELPNAFHVLYAEDRARIEAVVQHVIESRHPASYEYRIVRRDGALRYLRCNASIASIEGAGDTVLLSVITDVTELAEAEQQVALGAEQLKAITDNINGGVTATIIKDRTVRFLFSNDQYYAQLGYTREQYEKEVTNAFSLVHPEDRERVIRVTQHASDHRLPFTVTYRIVRPDGTIRWIQSKISFTSFAGVDEPVQLAVANDITAQREAEDHLRVSEEQFRIAAATGGRQIARYDVKTGEFHHEDKVLRAMGFGPVIADVPQAFYDAGMITQEYVPAFNRFYEQIHQGVKPDGLDTMARVSDGSTRWFHSEATVVFDAEGQPARAIIVTSDITEQREKEAVYRKWQQSLQQKLPESYTLLRCNISKNASFDSVEGSLLQAVPVPGAQSFRNWAREYANAYVYAEDRDEYLAFIHADTLLVNYYRDRRSDQIEFRETRKEGGIRWLRLSVELVEYANSTDVEAYLMYEDINEMKRAELLAKERADLDPLTGVYNRVTFTQEMMRIIETNSTAQHALLMLDIDGFKQLNDTLGHAVGDQALIDIANALRSILRRGDLVGRLGGDEFLVFLRDIPYDAIIRKKAKQTCALVRKRYGADVQISASVGIAVYPHDGDDFETLYRCADAALYSVKDTGKDNFAYFNDSTLDEPPDEPEGDAAPVFRSVARARKRMLIVHRDAHSRKALTDMFSQDYMIETANSKRIAMLRLRHYGAGLSVVLMDLPLEDALGLLAEMHDTLEMRTIPVIVIGTEDWPAAKLQAIQAGASEYIAKPADDPLVRLLVQAAVDKAENERQRAQNSYLLLQSNEEAKYRTVLDSTGTVVIEYDWINGIFSYDPSITRHIAGNYDARKLWHILLSDMVASVMDIKQMQDLVHRIANDRRSGQGSILVQLDTPARKRQWFRMGVFKRADEFNLASKMILTFVNVNDEVLSGDTLRVQAECDPLTGLYNRQTFLHKAEELVRSAPANHYLMAVGDIDNFKMVNDRFGHSEGDRLLVYIAQHLRTDSAAAGGLCGRLGNDVFAVLIPSSVIIPATAAEYPKELLARYPLNLETTCSIGCYIIDNPAMPADGMLDRATMARQTVKGKYDVKVAWYDETLRNALLVEQEITGSMETALSNGQFDIYLQPQYNHVTGEMCSVEALVRWLHPEQGVLYYPDAFIPLFEKNGFITKLDTFIWNRTAERLHRWIESGGTPVPVSVNVSRLDTHDPQLCDKLLAILEKYHIPIDLFRLEITESLFEEDPQWLAGVIDKLHSVGFLIEMDDFGSGYSSLNILKDVPVDILKLDMRFFSTPGHSDRSGIILSAIMRMARRLDLPVIAEGVETLEQADYLASIGCQVVQGYLYARPMPVAAFEKLLAESAVSPSAGIVVDAAASRIPRLWALDTPDSELFYRYMDAAVIFEYHDGTFEGIRVNRRFCELLALNAAAPLPTAVPFGMHPDDIPGFFAATERAIASGEEETVDVRRVFDDRPDVLHLRCSLRPISGGAGGALLLCSITERAQGHEGGTDADI